MDERNESTPLSLDEEPTPKNGLANEAAHATTPDTVKSVAASSADTLPDKSVAATASNSSAKSAQLSGSVDKSAPVEEILPAWLDETIPTPATKALIYLNVAIFVVMTVTVLLANHQSQITDGYADPLEGIFYFSSQTLSDWGANAAWKTILDQQYWRILTSTLIHASGLHLAMNMYVLWSFSSMVERLFGRRKFLAIYFVAAIGGSICSLPFLNPDGISVGASGAIYGTFGALVAFFWSHRAYFPKRFFRMYSKMFFVFVIYSVVSTMLFKGVDNAAHLGGFIWGLWAALCVLPAMPAAKSWRKIDFVRITGLLAVLMCGLVIVTTMDERNPLAIGEYNYDKGVRLLRRNDIQAAIDYFNKALQYEPQNTAVYLDRASAYGRLNQWDKSLPDVTRALRLDPKSKKGYFVLSYAHHHLGNEEEAIADLNRVLFIDPKAVVAYNNRAWSLEALGKPDAAIADCTTAIGLDARAPSAYDTRGVAYCLKGLYDPAIADFNTYASLKPDEGAVYYHRAYAYFKQGKMDLAKQDLSRARASKYDLEPWEKQWLQPVLSL
jgi:membrane associated rhomboid family serine protease/Flp pilus assembly protein TadD